MAKKVTEDEIRSRLEGRPLTLLRYAGSVLGKSLFKCHVDGHEWEATADNVTRGRGCPKCKLVGLSVPKNEAEDRVRRLGFTLVNYVKSSQPVTVRCVKPGCGHETAGNNLQHIENLQGCRKCWERERGLLDEQVYPALKARNISLLYRASNTTLPSRFRCDLDGHEWETNLSDVLRGQGCKKCAGLLTLTAEDVRQRLMGRPITLVSFAGSGTSPYTRFRCDVDGHEWETTANSVLSGQGCAKCAGNISKKLEDVQSLFDAQDVTIKLYAGYTKRGSVFQCNKDGYEWVGVVRDVIDNPTFCPRCSRREAVTLQRLIDSIAGRPIRVLSFAEGSNSRSTFKCTSPGCGHVWSTSNSGVIGGTGCPKCAGVLRMTEKEVRRKVATRPELTLVAYAGTSESPDTLWHCNSCGGRWKAPVGRIFGVHKSGCPHCASSGFNPSAPATLYAYSIQTNDGRFLGFGITGDIDKRDYLHQRSFTAAAAVGDLLWTIDHPDGQAVWDVEREIKRTFTITSSGVAGFIDEAMLYEDGLADRLYSYVMEKLDLNCNTGQVEVLPEADFVTYSEDSEKDPPNIEYADPRSDSTIDLYDFTEGEDQDFTTVTENLVSGVTPAFQTAMISQFTNL